jgi:hypothetical protein
MILVLATVLLLQPPPAVGTPSPAGQGAVAPYFRLSADPASVSVRRGATERVTVSVTPMAGFTGTVSLVSSHLLGTRIEIEPSMLDASVPATSALTVSPGRDAIKGTYRLTITGAGNGASHTITIKVEID